MSIDKERMHLWHRQRYKNFQQVINRDPCSLWNILSQYSDMDIIYEEGRSNGKERLRKGRNVSEWRR
ncbi:Monolignol oxidoreductase AtBBE-like [Trichinella pseudospiralis]